MNHDAILSELSIRFRRFLMFLILTSAFWLCFWSLPLVKFLNLGWKQLPSVTEYVLENPSSGLFAYWFWISGCMGLLLSSVLFLAIAHWWSSRGDIYRRGARMLDQRNRRN